jgi:glycosyltransferase involved in cell wall biosynthesis
MRLLVLSSFYPPHHLGGYELAAESAVEGLRARGHDIQVLTSVFRTADGEREPEPPSVARDLHLYWRDGAWDRPASLEASATAAREDLDAFDRAVERARPDAVWAWHLAALSKSLLARAGERGLPVVLALHDLWPLYDRVDPWLRWLRGVRKPAGLAAARREGLPTAPPDLRTLAGASYNSLWTRGELFGGGRTPDGPVIHPPVDPERFAPGPPVPTPIRRFLHLGRVEPRKGPMVAVRALAHARAGGLADATLTLAGPSEGGHAEEVLALAVKLGIPEAVSYLGPVDRAAVPDLYRSHDAVIHSATWEEPFGLVPVEAMATGRPVIASPTGGALETVEDGTNALAFPKGDAGACAAAMVRLAADPSLAEALVREGFATAARFGPNAITPAHEAHLREVLGRD